MAKFISIVSLKPNIGNTTIALNLGLALHNIGKKVVVLDADFSKINMFEHLFIQNLPVDLSVALDNDSHIRDSIFTHLSGLKIIPSLESTNSLFNYEKLGLHLPELSAHNDFVIIDAPKNIDNLQEVLGYSDEAVIVHSPEYSAKYVYDMQKILSNKKVVNLGIILNKSHEYSVNSLFNSPVISKIPENSKIVKSFQTKHPFLYMYPDSPVSKKFLNIARLLV